MKKHFQKKSLFFVLIVISITVLLFNPWKIAGQLFPDVKDNQKIIYTMVNVCPGIVGDAHVLTFKNNSVYIIDAGNVRTKLVNYLKKHNIQTIDKLFISHAHKDHYGGIFDLIESGIKIKKVYFNVPNKEACDSEKPWGCDYEHVLRMIKFIKDHNIPVESLKAGDTFIPQNDQVLKVLAIFDGYNTPIGKTDINDTSAIMKLSYGTQSILFTGDLNRRLGDYLVKSSLNLKADILKVPHHGTEGVASNEFFDAVSPKLALVPSPKGLWLSDRSKRIRAYFFSKNIPVLVSGIDGDITLILYKDRYEVVKE